MTSIAIGLEGEWAGLEKKPVMRSSFKEIENPLDNSHMSISGGMHELTHLVDSEAYIWTGQSDILKGINDATI